MIYKINKLLKNQKNKILFKKVNVSLEVKFKTLDNKY